MRKRYTVAVCGHVAFGTVGSDGQTVKTQQLYESLCERYGASRVFLCDTAGWHRHPIAMLRRCVYAVRSSQAVVMAPAHKGVRVFAPLFALLHIFTGTQLYYCVIGGWLARYTQKNRILRWSLSRFRQILVETEYTRQELAIQGMLNVSVVPNFKHAEVVHDSRRSQPHHHIRAVIFSRIMQEKGIEDAIAAIEHHNATKAVPYTLDIYGPIDPSYAKTFAQLKQAFPASICYKGVVDTTQAPQILVSYDVLLFPTHFRTEGLPGSIIDAQLAGVPTIAAAWQSASEMIEPDKTGMIYVMNEAMGLQMCLERFTQLSMVQRQQWQKNCIRAARRYSPEYALKPLIHELDMVHLGPERVMHVVPSLGIGGAEKVAIDLARGCDKRQFAVTVMSLYSTDATSYDARLLEHVSAVSLHKKRGFDPRVVWRMYRAMRQLRPDVVHTHLYVMPYVLGAVVACRVPKRFHTVHSLAEHELPPLLRAIMWLSYRLGGFVPVAISPSVKRSVLRQYRLRDDHVPHIFNGVRIQDYTVSDRQESSRIRLVSVARLTYAKNHQLMLDAFAHAVQKTPLLHLTLVGDGPLKSEIQKQITELSLGQHVTLKGATHDVRRELAQADIYIATSRYEGMPLSVVEAMAAGLPVITTPAGGVLDIIHNSENADLTKPDKHYIAKAIIDLAHDTRRRHAYGRASKHLAQQYDSQRMVENYEKLYAA